MPVSVVHATAPPAPAVKLQPRLHPPCAPDNDHVVKDPAILTATGGAAGTMPEPSAPPLRHGASGSGAGGVPEAAWCPNARLEEMRARHDISSRFFSHLMKLTEYDVVFVCDDSGSMNARCDTGGTRWTELRDTVGIVADIACCFDDDGIDVYFLNRPPLRNVTDAAALREAFAAPPRGTTPLVRTVRRVVEEKLPPPGAGKPLLLIVATDGEPDEGPGEFARWLRTRDADRIPVGVLLCTDNDDEIAYLNRLDTEVPRLDVVDDYRTERGEVLRAQGAGFPFSRGDYVVKALLGPIDPYFDGLDEGGDVCSRLARAGCAVM